MRLRFLLAAMLLSSVVSTAQTTIVDSIQSGGVWRGYRLYLPANYNANTTQRPLVLNLHGLGSNAFEQENYGDFRSIADTAGFLVVHPNGTFYSGFRYWNVGLVPGGADDVVFLSALIDTISARYRVDAQRVFSVGLSNGGFMSYYLAARLPQKIAAIASVAGSMTTSSYPPQVVPTHPLPVMQIHGTADAVVPYNGGPTTIPGVSNIPVDTLVNFWARFNGCNPTPQVSAIANTSTTDGCTAERFLYTGGTNGSTVELFKIAGGGHTWPGAVISNGAGATNQDFSASAEIWRFLRGYSLNTLSVTQRTKGATLNLRAVPNPAHTSLLVEGGAPDGRFDVRDATGRSVRTGTGQRVGLEGLAHGAYLLRYTGRSGAMGTVMFVKE